MTYPLTRLLLLALLMICGHGAFAAEGQSTAEKTVKDGESSTRVKGPTLEQTVQFINNVLSGLEGYVAFSDKNPEVFYEFISGSVDENCSVHLKHKAGLGNANENKFSLRDIERVSGPIRNGWGISIVGFHTSQSQKLISGTTRLGAGAGNYTQIPTDNEQLAKAFDHLRKLCGGPEPIKF